MISLRIFSVLFLAHFLYFGASVSESIDASVGTEPTKTENITTVPANSQDIGTLATTITTELRNNVTDSSFPTTLQPPENNQGLDEPTVVIKSVVEDVTKPETEDDNSHSEDNNSHSEDNDLSDSAEKETATTETSNVLKSETAKKEFKNKNKPLKKKEKTLTTENYNFPITADDNDEKTFNMETTQVALTTTEDKSETNQASVTDMDKTETVFTTVSVQINEQNDSGTNTEAPAIVMDSIDVENIAELSKDSEGGIATTILYSKLDIPNEIGGSEVKEAQNSNTSTDSSNEPNNGPVVVEATESERSTTDLVVEIPLTTSDGRTSTIPTTAAEATTVVLPIDDESKMSDSMQGANVNERQPKNLDLDMKEEAVAVDEKEDSTKKSDYVAEPRTTVVDMMTMTTDPPSEISELSRPSFHNVSPESGLVDEQTVTVTTDTATNPTMMQTTNADMKPMTDTFTTEATTTLSSADEINRVEDHETEISTQMTPGNEDGVTVTDIPNFLFTDTAMSIATLSSENEQGEPISKGDEADASESSNTGNRRQKQMNFDRGCPCADATMPFDLQECSGERTVQLPQCECSELCARQSGESCSSKEPCDHDFGLQCQPETNICQGPVGIEKIDITHNSATIHWGKEKSEIPPQATVFFTSTYRGEYTDWTEIQIFDTTATIQELRPNTDYFIKVEQDGKQEIAVVRTKDGCMYNATLSYAVGEKFNLTCNETCTCYAGGEPECHERCFYPPEVLTDPFCFPVPDENDPCCMTYKCKANQVGDIPKILITQITPNSLTAMWDDFRLPSHHSAYILEYRVDDGSNQVWTQAQPGSQPMATLTDLKPATPYQLRVNVWEDGEKKSVVSEVVSASTNDGCVRENVTHYVGDVFFRGCDLRCTCIGGDEEQCVERCNSPYVKVGSKALDDPLCYEKPLQTDPCCVMVRCPEGRALEEEAKDHEDICTAIQCGPNAVCISATMSCKCNEGFEGNPNDLSSGCTSSNTTLSPETGNRDAKNLVPNDLSEISTSTAPTSTMLSLKNDLETNNEENKLYLTTEDPLSGKLASKSSEEENIELSNADKNDERENVGNTVPHFSTEKSSDENNDLKEPPYIGYDIWNSTRLEENEENEDTSEDSSTAENSTGRNLGGPIAFDGCEYNNKTYERGVLFEDGCEARCLCDGRGHISCTPRCAVMASGGQGCEEVPDPDDPCCKIMVCHFPGHPEVDEVSDLSLKVLSAQPQNGTAVRIRLTLPVAELPAMVGRETLEVWFVDSTKMSSDISQWNKRAVMLKQLTEVQQGVFEFDISDLEPNTDYYFKVAKESSGATPLHVAEFSNTVNAKTFPAAVKAVFQGCFHHNKSYNLGEVFYQGCEFKCVCREKGFIECQDRCEIYIDTVGYEGCEWVPSEEDSCCIVPSCSRRMIPFLPGGGLLMGGPESLCVVGSDEVYRVGDMWELEDGCRTKICRCSMLSNGSTTIQCQSECPTLPPNAHIPTPRCPNPVLIKPDGPCSCPYISCTEAPRHMVQPPRPPQCEFKGKRYDMGQEFHDGCISLCHCGQDLRVSCAAIECPYHFSAEYTNCLEWDIDPKFFPSPPHCCAPSECKNDGSCIFSGQKFSNHEEIPSEMLPCGTICICVNGNVTCENRCPPVEDVPPHNMPCPPALAYKGHTAGETCCVQWMCKQPAQQAYCTFQGARYLPSEQWEIRKGSQRRLCRCNVSPSGNPEVECKGGCPQISQRYLLPTEQCSQPVIVTPDDPIICPYVVCNNSQSGQELHDVSMVAINSTAVRIRFTVSTILVGLIGHAELHFTTDPTLPRSSWHLHKFSRPKRLFDSPHIEYILNALRPNTTYFLQLKIQIDALQLIPESELFKLRMPEEVIMTSTTTLPPVMNIDANLEAHVIDANTVRVSWSNYSPEEKKLIYALQLKYKAYNEADDKWITTPMIHRDVTSYFLHDLKPSTAYLLDVVFVPPKDSPTKLISSRTLEIHTAAKTGDTYNMKIHMEAKSTGTENAEILVSGIPEPINKYVHVVRILYKVPGEQQRDVFKVPKSSKILLDHLIPGKKYITQMELYLTNGQTLFSNEAEFLTKPATGADAEDNIISDSHVNGKQAEPLQSSDLREDENRAYFIALVVVAVVAAVAGFGFVLLLVLLVRRQASAKAPISRTPSESAYDNPTYKTYDGERLEDKTNGQAIQTTQA